MQKTSNKNSLIAKNTLYLYLRMFFVLIVTLYTTRVVLNALGVIDYGIHNVVAGFVSMFAFLNTSMSNGIQRFYNFKLGSEGDSSLTIVYTTAFLIQLILAVFLFLFLETFGLWYLNNKMVIPADRMDTAQWIYQFSIISLVIIILQSPYNAAILAHERMNYYAYVSIIEVVLKLAIAFILPHIQTDKLFFYGFYVLLVGLLVFLLCLIYCKYHFKSIRLQFHLKKQLFREMLSFSAWNIFGTFAYMLKNQGLNILLNAFFGPVVNAARGVSMMIGNSIHGFQTNIVVAFRPQTVQSFAEGNLSRVRGLMYSLSKLSYIMLYMLSMPVIIELQYILKLWLNNTIPDYTVSFTILILTIMLISSLNTPLSQIVHATGKMKNYQVGTSIVICLILPIAWLALRFGGNPSSVYMVSLILTVFNQVVCMLLLKKIFPYSITEYLKEVIWPCAFVTVIAPILPVSFHFLYPDSFSRFLIVIVTGVGATMLSSYSLMMNKQEKGMIKEFIYKTIRKK